MNDDPDAEITLDMTGDMASSPDAALEEERAELDAAWAIVLADARRDDVPAEHEPEPLGAEPVPPEPDPEREPVVPPDPDLASLNAHQRNEWPNEAFGDHAEYGRRVQLLLQFENGHPDESETSVEDDDEGDLFTDLTALDNSTPIQTSIGERIDGIFLIYLGAINMIIGDPEQGKTLIAQAFAIEAAQNGQIVVLMDLDHNGPRATRDRLIALGADDETLRHIRYAQPEDSAEVMRLVRWTIAQAKRGEPVAMFIVDSIGELLPMFNASSDNADEYTKVNREVMASVARSGPAVLAIDHLAKGLDSRLYGGTGTIAKKRTVDGAMYRVEAKKQFAPGKGGEAKVILLKDRHGWVRSNSDPGSTPIVARFVLQPDDANGPGTWEFETAAPVPQKTPAQLAAAAAQLAADVTALDKLDPPPTGGAELRKRMGWGGTRCQNAIKAWKAAKTS